MVDITINPVLVQWGPIAIGWHGLWLAAGIVLGYLVFRFESRRVELDRDRLTGFLLWLAISGYIGARLLHVFLYDWETYAGQPLKILAVQEGGLAVYGGLIGGTIAAVAYARWKDLAFWHLADATAVPIAAGVIVGRVGCTILGDVAGLPTNGAWGLVYWHPNAAVPAHLLGVPTFPAPIMMQFWNVGLLLLLFALRKRLQLPGALFLIFLIVYSVGRFLISIWQPESLLLFGLRPTQLVALLVTSLAILSLVYLRKEASAFSPA